MKIVDPMRSTGCPTVGWRAAVTFPKVIAGFGGYVALGHGGAQSIVDLGPVEEWDEAAAALDAMAEEWLPCYEPVPTVDWMRENGST